MSTAPAVITFHRADPNHVKELIELLNNKRFRYEFGPAAISWPS